MGRFWSPDPGPANLGNPTSWNRYAYTTGDPVNLNDPTGLDPGGIMLTPDPPPDGPPASVSAICMSMLTMQWYQMQFTDGDYAGYPSAQLACQNAGNSQIVFTSGPKPGGGGPIPDAAMGRELVKALRVAERMLDNPACRALFGLSTTPDPRVILANLYSSGNFVYGAIPSEAGTVTSATTAGVGRANTVPASDGTVLAVSASVVITLNNTGAGASFVSGDTRDQAITLLHELGHAIVDLYGPGASTIVPDGSSTPTSIRNTKTVQNVCH